MQYCTYCCSTGSSKMQSRACTCLKPAHQLNSHHKQAPSPIICSISFSVGLLMVFVVLHSSYNCLHLSAVLGPQSGCSTPRPTPTLSRVLQAASNIKAPCCIAFVALCRPTLPSPPIHPSLLRRECAKSQLAPENMQLRHQRGDTELHALHATDTRLPNTNGS